MVCSKLFFCDLKNYFEVTNILLPRFSPLVVVCCLIPLANIAMPTQPAHATCWVFAGITRALSLANADWHHARECAEEEVHPRFVKSTVRPCSPFKGEDIGPQGRTHLAPSDSHPVSHLLGTPWAPEGH